MSLKTFRGYLIALEAGRISVHQALFQWTYIAAGNTTVSAIREYAPLVREWLPKAEWPPEGVHLKEPGYLEYTWHGPADFYEFADHRLGGAFEVGKFLAEFVAEHDPKIANELLTKHEQKVARAEKAKELRVHGKTFREIAEETEVSIGTAHSDVCSEKSEYTPKTEQKPRKVIQYRISQYTKPETAARRIREVFGDEFAGALAESLMEAA